MNRLIGICGPAQHGKNTVGEILRFTYGYKLLAFATRLKELAYALNPLLGNHDDNGNPLRLQELVDLEGWDEAKKHPEVRRFLQRVGTEGGRQVLDTNIWVDQLDKQTIGHDLVAVTDLRFPDNEQAYFKERGGLIIKVVRPGFDNGVGNAHASEAGWPLIKEDVLISNDGTLEDLELKVIHFMESIP